MSIRLMATKGRIGNNTYYLTKMKASTLIREVGYAFELTDSRNLSIVQTDEQELRLDRVINDLVPYITTNKDWFFGTLTVVISKGGDQTSFKPLKDVMGPFVLDLLESQEGLDEVGYLTLPDERKLVAIDGQHRLAALSIATYGKNGIPLAFARKKALDYERMGLKQHPEIASADISVMLLIPKSDEDFGKISSKIGKQAKYSTRSADILHSDDDILAITARRLLDDADAPLGRINGYEIVNCKNNTISDRNKWFTTLSALYNICEIILGHYSITKKMEPDIDTTESAARIMKTYWEQIMEPFEDYKTYKELVRSNAPIEALRHYSLIMKPAMQTAIAYAVHIILDINSKSGNDVDYDNNFDYGKELDYSKLIALLERISSKLTLIDWSWDNELWKDILVTNDRERRVKSGKQSIKMTGRIIAYMLIGDLYGERETKGLISDFRRMKGDPEIELPAIL